MSTSALLMKLVVLCGFGVLAWMLVKGRVGSGFAFPASLILSACFGLELVSQIIAHNLPDLTATVTFAFIMIVQIVSAVLFAKRNNMLKQ